MLKLLPSVTWKMPLPTTTTRKADARSDLLDETYPRLLPSETSEIVVHPMPPPRSIMAKEEQIRTPTWLSKESRRNSKISAVIHPHNAPLDQLVMICSIGKLRLWAHQSLPIREVSSSSLSTSQQTIHSNHQRLPSPLEFIIRTSIQTEASALTFSVRSGRRL